MKSYCDNYKCTDERMCGACFSDQGQCQNAPQPAQHPLRGAFLHLFNAAAEEPAATPRLVNATRTARGHLFGDGKPMREAPPAAQEPFPEPTFGDIIAQRDALREACKRFVAKVENGHARSRSSYAEMKIALAMMAEPDNEAVKAKRLADLQTAFVDTDAEANWVTQSEQLNCPACGGSGHVGDIPPVSPTRQAAIDLYKPPFKFDRGYIFDADSQMVADDHGQDTVARVRGWGRIQNMPDAANLQDEVGRMIVDALNAYYACQPSN